MLFVSLSQWNWLWRFCCCRNIEKHSESEKIIQESKNHCTGQTFQQGVLRSNCIDCLDRTNVAQYAFGLAALGHQMHILGLCDVPRVGSRSTLAITLMEIYEKMGDALAIQYGGSAAHNKVNCLAILFFLELRSCVCKFLCNCSFYIRWTIYVLM
jgi:hypothetical protein